MGDHKEFLKVFAGLIVLLLGLAGSIYYLENFQQFSNNSSKVAVQTPTSVPTEKKKPDAYSPSSGVCLEPLSGNVVIIKINGDTSSSRCFKVLSNQKLQVENATTKTVNVKIGPFNTKLGPSQKQLFDANFDTYLEPGVHFVSTSPFTGTEIWFQR